MKKLLSLLIVVCLIAAILPAAVLAAESGSCGENVAWTLDGQTLTISGSGSTADYTTLDTAPWYSQRAQIRTIVVEEGITRLGERIFAYTTNATVARLPSTLKEIGKEAFSACYGLKRADLPEELEVIGQSAFSSCKVLDGIVLPESLERIEPYAFHFTGLTSITIPKSITTLEEHTFGSCKKLTEVNFHENVDTIHDFCFSGCESLRTIELPEKLDEISWGCFSISGLETVTIPENVRIIDSYAFDQCWELEEIHIPDTVTVMEQYCLRQTRSLKTVDLPDRLRVTGWGMFSGGGLESITLPDGLTTVTEYTFCDCDSLTEVIVPDSVVYMEDYCFMDCDSLKTVELPNKLKYLGWGMFQDSALETLVIPDSVSYTEDYVFSGCDRLESITYPERPFTFGDYAFAYCEGPETFDLPPQLTQLSWGMFSGSTIEYIEIPESVTWVEDYAFCNCDYLEVVVFPDGVTRMGDYIFRDCDGIRSVHMPASLRYVPRGCFWNSSLEELTIPEGVTQIKDQAFWDAWILQKLVIPRSVTSIGGSKTFEGADIMVIYCWADSFIHKYAEENGIPYVLMDEPAEPENPFTDVSETDYYYDAVLWARGEGITSGTSATTFGPADPCRRAQVVMFLWRAMGSPEPVNRVNPFTDVAETDYYYAAVLWAVEQGITSGVTPDTFGPDAVCSRAQIVTFLYQAMDRPAMSGKNPFADVKPGDYYYTPVLWAVEAGITSGVDAAHFAPERDCIRAHVVTFLYKALAEV